MTKIRLTRGAEPVELSGRLFMSGLLSGDVQASGICEIQTIPQLCVVPVGLLVDSDTAAAFELWDIRIGSNSMFINSDALPLTMFEAPPSQVWPHMAELRLADEGFREVIDLGVCQVSQQLKLFVRNISGSAARFRGAWLLRCAPSSTAQA